MLLPLGARLDEVAAIASERGMAVEDPRVFCRTFPALNFPGEPFAVLHGRLPGTSLNGRLLCCAERLLFIPDQIRELRSDPGGQVGCDVAVIELTRTLRRRRLKGSRRASSVSLSPTACSRPGGRGRTGWPTAQTSTSSPPTSRRW